MDVHLDIETRSRANLPEVGASRYADDPTTEIFMAAVSATRVGAEVYLWINPKFENAGIRVSPETESQPTAVEIILKEFKLDLVERKWVVQITYQANLLEQNRFVSGQTITGNAERLRVVGSKDAEKVIGELITDAVNRLNLDELFQPTRS